MSWLHVHTWPSEIYPLKCQNVQTNAKKIGNKKQKSPILGYGPRGSWRFLRFFQRKVLLNLAICTAAPPVTRSFKRTGAGHGCGTTWDHRSRRQERVGCFMLAKKLPCGKTNIAGWKLSILDRKYIDSLRVHDPASYFSWSRRVATSWMVQKYGGPTSWGCLSHYLQGLKGPSQVGKLAGVLKPSKPYGAFGLNELYGLDISGSWFR